MAGSHHGGGDRAWVRQMGCNVSVTAATGFRMLRLLSSQLFNLDVAAAWFWMLRTFIESVAIV